MNYLKLVNAFWQADMEHHFTPNDTRLYFFLLHTCNQLGWKMPFGHSDRHLAYSLGVSVNTVRDGKDRLQQRGLIKFAVPEKKSKSYEGQTKYTLIPPTVSKIDTDTDTDVDTVTGTVPDTDADTVPDTNNKRKPKKTKQDNSVELVMPFSESFTKVWDKWKRFKKDQHRFTYKSIETEQAALNDLQEISNNDEATAKRIIDKSIAKGWKGLFAIKDEAPVVQFPKLAPTGTSTYNPQDPRHSW